MTVVRIPTENLPEKSPGEKFVEWTPGWGGSHATDEEKKKAGQTVAKFIDFLFPMPTKSMAKDEIESIYSSSISSVGFPVAGFRMFHGKPHWSVMYGKGSGKVKGGDRFLYRDEAGDWVGSWSGSKSQAKFVLPEGTTFAASSPKVPLGFSKDQLFGNVKKVLEIESLQAGKTVTQKPTVFEFDVPVHSLFSNIKKSLAEGYGTPGKIAEYWQLGGFPEEWLKVAWTPAQMKKVLEKFPNYPFKKEPLSMVMSKKPLPSLEHAISGESIRPFEHQYLYDYLIEMERLPAGVTSEKQLIEWFRKALPADRQSLAGGFKLPMSMMANPKIHPVHKVKGANLTLLKDPTKAQKQVKTLKNIFKNLNKIEADIIKNTPKK
tara:strand:- start:230 stop:1357 length:1128 start_codon:yes stop_codon:yes gene_type:complete